VPGSHIIGPSRPPLPKLDAMAFETLVTQAAAQALPWAQVEAGEIDAVFAGHAGAQPAGVFNMDGLAVANRVCLLEAAR